MAEDFSDQRRSPRVEHHFMARYAIPLRSPKQWLISPLKDLSSGGARFISEHKFSVNETFDLQLVLPTINEPVALSATIAWVRPGPMNMFEVGITFSPGDTAMQAVIDAAVARFVGRPSREE